MAAKTVAIIGARLNSSRLPRKHLLDLAGKPLILRLIDRLKQSTEITDFVVATTDDVYNDDLVKLVKEAGTDVYAHGGDVNDLMGRVDAVAQKYQADTIVYICGDSPLIEVQTIDRMVKAIASDEAADYVSLAPPSVGGKFIHEGFDVYTRSFWKQMMAAATEPFEREHVGAVWHSSGKVKPVKAIAVDDDPVFASITQRVSVDTPADYNFMKALYECWYADHSPQSVVDLKWVIATVKADPKLAQLNAHVHQKTATEVAAKALIICEASADAGLGHLARACVVANALQELNAMGVEIMIMGETVDYAPLSVLKHTWLSGDNLEHLQDKLEKTAVVIIDVKDVGDPLLALLNGYQGKIVLIDNSESNLEKVDLAWIPSFYFKGVKGADESGVDFGWQNYLLKPVIQIPLSETSKPKKVLILTGGSDPQGYSQSWPEILLSGLPETVGIHWVQGPFAKEPKLPSHGASNWQTLHSPDDLASLYKNYDAAICLYGVSFFECLKAKLPVIAVDPDSSVGIVEWLMLEATLPEFTAPTIEAAADKALSLLEKNENMKMLDQISMDLHKGSKKFAAAISHLLESDAAHVL